MRVRIRGPVRARTGTGLFARRTSAWTVIETDTALAQALRANTDALFGNAANHLLAGNMHPALFRAIRSCCEAGLLTAATNQP